MTPEQATFNHIHTTLEANEIPVDAIELIYIGASYFAGMSGTPMDQYWINKKFNLRDECFVVLNAYFHLQMGLQKYEHIHEWKLKFDVARLFQLKSTAQAAVSINELTKHNCYSDAFVICRTALSRVHLLMLVSLNPNLFDEWLNNPKHEKFLDGHIKAELQNNGILTLNQLYEATSEIVHSHAMGLGDIGYFEYGLFTEHVSVNNNIWAIFKFIIGMSYCVSLNMMLIDFENKKMPDELKIHQNLFNWFLESYLVYNRIDQMWAFISEDRHWEKIGKDSHRIGESFDFKGFEEQIKKYYRKGQKKTLSKKYNI